MSYERVMLLNEVHQDLWTRYFPAQMSPRALKVFARLSIEESRQYDVVKRRILVGTNPIHGKKCAISR